MAEPAKHRMRKKGKRNLAALTAAAARFRDSKQSYFLTDVFRAAAEEIGITPQAMKTWAGSIPAAERDKLIFGDAKISRFEEKLRILQEVRNTIPGTPTRGELADAAAKALGMTPGSVRNFVYTELTPAQAAALKLNGTLDNKQRLAVIREVRLAMRDRGAPPPRPIDLAQEVAQRLGVTPRSARDIVVHLPADVKMQLRFATQVSRKLHGRHPAVLRAAVIGAIDVLAYRELRPTAANIARVLHLSTAAVEEYLEENPSIRERLSS